MLRNNGQRIHEPETAKKLRAPEVNAPESRESRTLFVFFFASSAFFWLKIKILTTKGFFLSITF